MNFMKCFRFISSAIHSWQFIILRLRVVKRISHSPQKLNIKHLKSNLGGRWIWIILVQKVYQVNWLNHDNATFGGTRTEGDYDNSFFYYIFTLFFILFQKSSIYRKNILQFSFTTLNITRGVWELQRFPSRTRGYWFNLLILS